MEFPKGGSNLSLLEQLLGEDAQDLQRNWGVQGYKYREDGSARLTFQKRGKVSKREYEEQLAGTKDDFTALQEITTAIKSALSFLEE